VLRRLTLIVRAGIPTWCDRFPGGDGRFWEGSRQWAVTLTDMRTRRLIADRYSLVELLSGSATGSGWRAQDLWSGQLVMITRTLVLDAGDLWVAFRAATDGDDGRRASTSRHDRGGGAGGGLRCGRWASGRARHWRDASGPARRDGGYYRGFAAAVVAVLSLAGGLVVAFGPPWTSGRPGRPVAVPAPPPPIGDPRTADPCALLNVGSVQRFGKATMVDDIGYPQSCVLGIGPTSASTLTSVHQQPTDAACRSATALAEAAGPKLPPAGNFERIAR
jgi:hypothetical protein